MAVPAYSLPTQADIEAFSNGKRPTVADWARFKNWMYPGVALQIREPMVSSAIATFDAAFVKDVVVTEDMMTQHIATMIQATDAENYANYIDKNSKSYVGNSNPYTWTNMFGTGKIPDETAFAFVINSLSLAKITTPCGLYISSTVSASTSYLMYLDSATFSLQYSPLSSAISVMHATELYPAYTLQKDIISANSINLVGTRVMPLKCQQSMYAFTLTLRFSSTSSTVQNAARNAILQSAASSITYTPTVTSGSGYTTAVFTGTNLMLNIYNAFSDWPKTSQNYGIVNLQLS